MPRPPPALSVRPLRQFPQWRRRPQGRRRAASPRATTETGGCYGSRGVDRSVAMALTASFADRLQRRHVEAALGAVLDEHALDRHLMAPMAARRKHPGTQQVVRVVAKRDLSRGTTCRRRRRLHIGSRWAARVGQQPCRPWAGNQTSHGLNDLQWGGMLRAPRRVRGVDGILNERTEHFMPALVLSAKVGFPVGPAIAGIDADLSEVAVL